MKELRMKKDEESAEKSKGFYIQGQEAAAPGQQKKSQKSKGRAQGLKKGKASKKTESPRFASDEEEYSSVKESEAVEKEELDDQS
jgi:hypothetical protein